MIVSFGLTTATSTAACSVPSSPFGSEGPLRHRPQSRRPALLAPLRDRVHRVDRHDRRQRQRELAFTAGGSRDRDPPNRAAVGGALPAQVRQAHSSNPRDGISDQFRLSQPPTDVSISHLINSKSKCEHT